MAESFLKTYGRELLNTAAGVAKHIPGAKLAESIGTSIGLMTSKKQREETNRQTQETLDTILAEIKKARQRGDKAAIERWSTLAKGFNVVIPEQEITKDAASTREIIASGASLALLAATGFKPSGAGLKSLQLAKGQKLKSALKFARLQKQLATAEKLKGAGIAKKALYKVAKPVAKEAAIGAGFFGASKASERDAEVNDIIKAAGTGALVSGGLTAGMIGLGAGIQGFQSKVAPKISERWGKLTEGLEKVARGETAKVKPGAAPLTQVQKTLQYIGEKPVTMKQKTAKAAIWGIEQARKVQTRLFDRFSPAARIQKKLERMLGRPLDDNWEKVYRDFRLADAVAEGKSELMLTDLTKRLGKYADIQDDWLAYMSQLDFYDRAKLGYKVPGDQSIDDIVAGLRKMSEEIGPAKMKRVDEVRNVMKSFNERMLNMRREAGLISEAEVLALNKAHPNYIPHDVILDIDDMATQGLAGSLNIPKTDLTKAIGSARNIKNPLEAITARTNIAMRTIERNKILGNLAKVQESYGAIDGMKPLVTAKRVLERRAAFKELAATRMELERIKDSLKLTGKTNKALNSKILEAEKRIEDLFNEGLAKVIKEGDEELFRFVQREVDDAISLPMAQRFKGGVSQEMLQEGTPKEIKEALFKAYKKGGMKGGILRGEMTKVDILKYGQANVNSFNRIKEVINANPQLSNEAKAKLIVDFQKGLANKGKIVIPQNITGSELAKDIQTVISENRQAAVDKLLAKYKAGKMVGTGMGAHKTSAFGLNRKILKQKFNIFQINKDVAQTEEQLNLLLSGLDDKKTQIKGIVDEIQALAAGKKGLEEQTINFFRDGIKESWVVPTDVAYMVKNLDTPLRGTGWKILTAPQRVMKKLSTQYNLSFALPNKFRDEQTAALTANAFIEEMAKRTGVSPQQLNLSAKEIQSLYKKSGGFGSSIFREGEHLLTKKGMQTKLPISMNPAKIIDTINNKLEQSTRLEVFRKALERGLTAKDAAFVSRNATIDFARMGTWMRSANQAVPFLNARVQGFLNLPKAFVANPAVFARMQFYTSAYPTMLLHQHNTRFDSYGNISQYFKNKYWIIMTGEQEIRDPYTGEMAKIPQFVTLPKGEGQTLVSNPIQYYLEKADNLDSRSTRQMITETIGSASPLEFQAFAESDWKGTIVSQFGPIPTMLVGGFSGKHPYFGTDIIPPKRQEAPTEMQYKQSTPEMIKEAAGILDMPPAMLEFYISSFGGVPQDLIKIMDVVYGPEKLKGKSISESQFGIATQFPILRRFAREASEYYSPESTSQRAQKQEIEKEVTGKRLKISDRAEEILGEINKRETKEEKLDYLNSLGDELTPALKTKIKAIKTSRESVEALKKTDSVEVRARYIRMRLDEMEAQGISREERLQFLNDLTTSKILTNNVKKKMLELKQAQ